MEANDEERIGGRENGHRGANEIGGGAIGVDEVGMIEEDVGEIWVSEIGEKKIVLEVFAASKVLF